VRRWHGVYVFAGLLICTATTPVVAYLKFGAAVNGRTVALRGALLRVG
jgi:hypothetical protein